jgi:hypothetical protein
VSERPPGLVLPGDLAEVPGAAVAAPLWPRSTATGVGSLPGTDPLEAALLVAGELPDLPHLPELPDRGPGADLLGRGAGLLADLHVDLQPAGWRLVARPGVDVRRARDLLARDLDALEIALAGWSGPLKVQAAGPWTLAAGVELPRGDKVLADEVAVGDVTSSLAQGLADLVADVRRRVPGARLLVQVDEPTLPAVLAGRLRTASGFGALPTPEEPVAQARLAEVLGAVTAAGAVPAVHCCAARPPVALFAGAGARVVSVDGTLIDERDDDAVGEAVEAGVRLLLGLVPSTDPGRPARAVDLAQPARRLWSRLGFPAADLGEAVAVTPTCGLAAASASYARRALALTRDTARALGEDP